MSDNTAPRRPRPLGFLPRPTGATSATLVVLFLITVIDEYGEQSFGLLAPEIRATFRLSNLAFGNIFSVFTFLGIALALTIGWLGDRSVRVRLVQFGAAAAAAGAAVIGLALNPLLLVLGKLFSTAAFIVPNTVHNSVLTDTYEPEERSLAFGIHEGSKQLALVLVPLVAATVASGFGWRSAYLVMVPPLLLVALLTLRLREPVRGATDGRPDAEAAALEPAVPVRVAFRQLLAIRTLRRTWFAQVLILGAVVPYFGFASIYLSAAFGATILQRGYIGALASIFGLGGLLAGAVLAKIAMRGGLGRLQLFAGSVVAVGGALLAVYAMMPSLTLAIVMGATTAFVFSLNQSAQILVLSLVSPPRLRTQAYSYGALMTLGAVLTPSITGAIVDLSGIRIGLLTLTPFLVVGGMVLASAGKFAQADHERAVETLDIASRLRAERLEATEKSLLVCRGLDVYYDTVQVLFGVDFEVRQGEVIALLGTNGSGKSTLLKAIAGILNPREGNIFFDGRDITNNGPWDTAEAGVVLMPGGKSIFPGLTVSQNLDLATWLMRRDRGRARGRREEMLELFPRLRERLDQPAGNLSGGEQQQLALAQALMPKPKILLLDELSLGLAPRVVAELVQILRAAHARDPELTIVLVEQSVNVAMTLAERAYFLEKGEFRFSGRTAELLERPDILRAVFLEGAEQAAKEMV